MGRACGQCRHCLVCNKYRYFRGSSATCADVTCTFGTLSCQLSQNRADFTQAVCSFYEESASHACICQLSQNKADFTQVVCSSHEEPAFHAYILFSLRTTRSTPCLSTH